MRSNAFVFVCWHIFANICLKQLKQCLLVFWFLLRMENTCLIINKGLQTNKTLFPHSLTHFFSFHWNSANITTTIWLRIFFYKFWDELVAGVNILLFFKQMLQAKHLFLYAVTDICFYMLTYICKHLGEKIVCRFGL